MLSIKTIHDFQKLCIGKCILFLPSCRKVLNRKKKKKKTKTVMAWLEEKNPAKEICQLGGRNTQNTSMLFVLIFLWYSVEPYTVVIFLSLISNMTLLENRGRPGASGRAKLYASWGSQVHLLTWVSQTRKHSLNLRQAWK